MVIPQDPTDEFRTSPTNANQITKLGGLLLPFNIRKLPTKLRNSSSFDRTQCS